MDDDRITLAPARAADLGAFKTDLQAAFAVAVIETFGALPNGPIPSDDDLDQALAAPGAEVLHVLLDGQRVGGAVVRIDTQTNRNALDLFFISGTTQSRGVGLGAWRAIERRYPETRVWQTHTPSFETRNIHFYVNKCGFRIVEFFGPHHPDPHKPGGSDLPGGGEAFRFEKVMGDPG